MHENKPTSYQYLQNKVVEIEYTEEQILKGKLIDHDKVHMFDSKCLSRDGCNIGGQRQSCILYYHS